MKSWTIHYYDKKLIQWLDNMPIGMKAYYARISERMITYGPNLGMPFTRAMKDGLFELRIKAKEGISRIFFCTVKERKIVLLHGFIKKTEQTPIKELTIARKRLQEVHDADYTSQ
jgi:phage-related protein